MLIAEDARDIVEIVAFGVRMVCPDADVVEPSCAEALAALRHSGRTWWCWIRHAPSDLLEVLRQCREHFRIPVLMLSVRNTKADRVRVLELGAVDLAKPFDHLELLARLMALASGNGGAAGCDRCATPQRTCCANDLQDRSFVPPIGPGTGVRGHELRSADSVAPRRLRRA